MHKSLIRVFIVLAFIACLFLFVHWMMVRGGIPQIETAVRSEVALLSSSNATLHTLQLEATTRRQISWDLLTGHFTFSGSYSSQPCDIIVSWSKVDTNAPIDNIQVKTAQHEPEMLWSRK